MTPQTMVEAGFTLAQIQQARVLESTASYEERQQVATALAAAPLIDRVKFAMLIAGIEASVKEDYFDPIEDKVRFGVLSPIERTLFVEKIHNALGTHDRRKGFANGLEYWVSAHSTYKTRCCIYVPHDFAPFEP